MPRAESVLRERIDELEAEKAELEGAIAALAVKKDAATPAVRRPSATRPKRAKKPGTKPRIPRAQREEQLIAEALASPETSNNELAQKLGVTPAYISMLLKDLGQAGRLSREDGRFVRGV